MLRINPSQVRPSLSHVNIMTAAAAAQSPQSCPMLCSPTDGSPPGSPVPGILQARTLEWAAISFSRACMHAKSLQSCPTLCDPTDSSPPGSSIHRVLQARVLEWAAISFSKYKDKHWFFKTWSTVPPQHRRADPSFSTWAAHRCLGLILETYSNSPLAALL